MSSISAGRLRHFVTIQSLNPSQDAATGEITNGWVEFAVVSAAVEPLSTREFIAAAAAQSKVSTRVVIRYLAGVKPSMRVLHRENTYNIEGVLADKDSGRAYLTLLVSEVIDG